MSWVPVKPIERTDVLRQLKSLVAQVVPFKTSDDQIQDDANLYRDWLDSTSIVELVLRIEEFFGVAVDSEDLEIELFQDLSKLTDMVVGKLEQSTSEYR